MSNHTTTITYYRPTTRSQDTANPTEFTVTADHSNGGEWGFTIRAMFGPASAHAGEWTLLAWTRFSQDAATLLAPHLAYHAHDEDSVARKRHELLQELGHLLTTALRA